MLWDVRIAGVSQFAVVRERADEALGWLEEVDSVGPVKVYRLTPTIEAEREQPAARLRAAGETAYQQHLASLTDTAQRILVERPGLGRTEGFTLAAIDAGAPGEIVTATIAGNDGERLLAVPASAARAA